MSTDTQMSLIRQRIHLLELQQSHFENLLMQGISYADILIAFRIECGGEKGRLIEFAAFDWPENISLQKMLENTFMLALMLVIDQLQNARVELASFTIQNK